MGYKSVCFNCRKAFNKSANFSIRNHPPKCPECSHSLTWINHKFSPPPQSDIRAWKVAKFLCDNGFPYDHVFSVSYLSKTPQGRKNSTEKYAPFPTKMKDAKDFVETYKHQAKKTEL